MNTYSDPGAPFEVGERVVPMSLMGWDYAGLAGVPDKPNAVRRYIKGMWVLELSAFSNRKRPARVLSIRTESEDKQWWSEKAQR